MELAKTYLYSVSRIVPRMGYESALYLPKLRVYTGETTLRLVVSVAFVTTDTHPINYTGDKE